MDHIEPPQHLSQTSKELFAAYVPGAFTAPAQQTLFIIFLECLDLHNEIIESIKTEGMMIEGSVGNMRANPLIREKRKTDAQLMRLAGQLGLEKDFEHVFNKGSLSWLCHQIGP